MEVFYYKAYYCTHLSLSEQVATGSVARGGEYLNNTGPKSAGYRCQ